VRVRRRCRESCDHPFGAARVGRCRPESRGHYQSRLAATGMASSAPSPMLSGSARASSVRSRRGCRTRRSRFHRRRHRNLPTQSAPLPTAAFLAHPPRSGVPLQTSQPTGIVISHPAVDCCPTPRQARASQSPRDSACPARRAGSAPRRWRGTSCTSHGSAPTPERHPRAISPLVAFSLRFRLWGRSWSFLRYFFSLRVPKPHP